MTRSSGRFIKNTYRDNRPNNENTNNKKSKGGNISVPAKHIQALVYIYIEKAALSFNVKKVRESIAACHIRSPFVRPSYIGSSL